MKKGPLNFLGRKNRNLFDINVEIKETEPVELMLDSAAIPESGTAKVRSRPTVKHFMSNDSFQGFAVPTPKVPILPPFNEPTVNGRGSPRNLQNGGTLSAYDMSEGELFVPPPPSSAPPPPPPAQRPPSFIPPPPPSHGDRYTFIDTASLTPPLIKPPKPPSHQGSDYSDELDLASLRPPPMAPPKPPSDTSSFRGSVSSLDYEEIPDCPKFTPPPPPSLGKPPPVLPKTQKMPPLKPIRYSSIPNVDIQSRSPTPPLASTPRPSSFNPQNTAKLYQMPKGTVLTGQVDREKPVQSILLLEDSTGNPVGVHVNGNSGGSLQQVESVPPVKPARRGSTAAQLENDIPDSVQIQAPSQPTKQEVTINPEPEATTPLHFSPKIEKPDVGQVKTHGDIPGRSHRYSPLLNHRHLKTQGLESSGKKNVTSTSPLALLMASKEREKQKNSLSRQNSSSCEPQTSVIQPNVEKPSSFTIIPRDLSERATVEFKPTTNTQAVVPLSTKVDISNGPYTKSVLSSTPRLNPTPTNISAGVQCIPVRDEENGKEMLFIPPPPEFANSDTEDEHPAPPPTHPAPAPPLQATPPSFKPPMPPPVTNSPLITPKPKPLTCPPKAPCPPPVIQPKPPVQIKFAPPPVQAPQPATPSQSTLLSILQRKMLEMDQHLPQKEADFNDDWNSPLSDDEGMAPPVFSKPLQTRSSAPPARPQGLDMKELENKAAKKAQDLSSSSRLSNGPSSKQTCGKTFIVRPGSKQPITPVIKN